MVSAIRAQADVQVEGGIIQLETEALSQCEANAAHALAVTSTHSPDDIAEASQDACRGEMTTLRHALVGSGMAGSIADGAVSYEEAQTKSDLIAAIKQWQATAFSRGP